MTHADWIALFAPAVAALVLALAGLLGALVTGLLGRLRDWLTAKGQASAAAAVASANTVINGALQTGANTIAGKIQRGELDYGDRAALEAEATREVGMAEQRVPAMMALATPVAGALVANLMGKVEAAVVASPTLPLASASAAAQAPG